MLFWLASPYYLTIIGHAVAAILNGVFGVGIDGITVTPEGILNTGTVLAFSVGERVAPIQPVALVMGIPTFVSLTLASPWPGAKRFAVVTLIGCVILVATHILYVVLVFRFAEAMQRSPQLPIMIVMLPFLLWIVLSYWRQIAAYFDESAPKETPPAQ